MRKITFWMFMLFAFMSYGQGQTCEQYFGEEGFDQDPVVLTVNSSDLTCAVGTVNSITITDAYLDDDWAWWLGETFCMDYYTFELDIDGEVSSVCASDLIGMEITGFETLTITSADADDYEDYIYIELMIEVNYSVTDAPDCAEITGPASSSEAALNGFLTWEEVAGAEGYRISMGTTPGGVDVLNEFEAGDVTSYNVPGTLEPDTDYFVRITAYNEIGDASDCTEYVFSVPLPPTGSTCADPILVDALPYSVTGNTSDYFDTIYEGTPGTGCSSSNYLNGNDAIYAYTATFTGTMTVNLTPTATYAGMFIYGDCDSIGTNCLAGAVNGNNTNLLQISEFSVTEGETYYLLISTWATPQTTGYTLNITEDVCTSPTATYAVVSDCGSGMDQFFVNVTITDLGSATSLTVADNQDGQQTATATGVLTFGPYANNTSVVITVAHDDNETCSLTSPAQTQTICPPINDECIAAIPLTVGGAFEDYAFEANTTGATRNPADHNPTTVANTCDTNNFLLNGKDVWFSVEVPASGSLTIETGENDDADFNDTALYIYTGTCDALTYVKCSSDINAGAENYFSKAILTDLVPGETVIARVWGYNGSYGAFRISAYDASMSSPEFGTADFQVYPNPVEDILNFSYLRNITNVEVYNLVGQQVAAKVINADQGQINMAELSAGTYLVKVTADDQVKTIKVIKK